MFDKPKHSSCSLDKERFLKESNEFQTNGYYFKKNAEDDEEYEEVNKRIKKKRRTNDISPIKRFKKTKDNIKKSCFVYIRPNNGDIK